MSNFANKYLALLGCLFVLTLAGCEKLSSLKDYFGSSSDSQATAPAQKAAPAGRTLASTAPSKDSISKSLPDNVLARVGSWTLTVDEFGERLQALTQVVPGYDISDPRSRQFVLENMSGQPGSAVPVVPGYDISDPRSRQFVLEELIRQELLVQDAEASGVAQEKDIVRAVEEFRRTLLVREVANRITEDVRVTDAEVQGYYNENKQDFVSPAQWRLREIVVDAEARAKEILIEVLKGTDFAQMARDNSIGYTASNGGDLGLVDFFEFPQMENAVAALEAGDVSSVFKGPQGYYIVKLEEKVGGQPQAFEDIKEEIKQGLTLLKQQQAILQYLEGLQQKTTIEINESLLKG